jgi:hypothetical protein
VIENCEFIMLYGLRRGSCCLMHVLRNFDSSLNNTK